MTWRDLAPDDANTELSTNSTLRVLDVRTQPEHLSHRIEGAQLVPVQELQMRVGELDADTGYLVVCEHGVRSVAACQFLETLGFSQLANLRGGMAAWLAAGLPHQQGAT